jgi:hypothetical protein
VTLCSLLEIADILEERNSFVFCLEDGGITFIQNDGRFLPDYTLSLYHSSSFPRGLHSTILTVRDVSVMIH